MSTRNEDLARLKVPFRAYPERVEILINLCAPTIYRFDHFNLCLPVSETREYVYSVPLILFEPTSSIESGPEETDLLIN